MKKFEWIILLVLLLAISNDVCASYRDVKKEVEALTIYSNDTDEDLLKQLQEQERLLEVHKKVKIASETKGFFTHETEKSIQAIQGRITIIKQEFERRNKALPISKNISNNIIEKGKNVITKGRKVVKNIERKITDSEKKLPMSDIKEIKKFVATDNGLLLLYTNNSDQVAISAIDPKAINGYSNVPLDNQEELSAVAAYKDKYFYGIFNTDKKGSIIRYTENNVFKNTAEITKAHKTPIQDLYFDGTFILSHSQAGNIRILRTAHMGLQGGKIKRVAEYSAERLVDYREKCMIVEEKTLLPGSDSAIYIKYLNNDGEIIADKKIRSYRKPVKDGNKVREYSPFCGAINEEGATVIYDQNSRSLIHSFKVDDGSIFSYEYHPLTEWFLPKKLSMHSAQGIHYSGNTVFLMYEDCIYKATLSKNEKPKCLTAELFFAVGRSGLLPNAENKDIKTIVATALQNENTLWVIMQKGTEYSIQPLPVAGKQ